MTEVRIDLSPADTTMTAARVTLTAEVAPEWEPMNTRPARTANPEATTTTGSNQPQGDTDR